jgi:multiple sugar transport system ATP-binding protein
MSSIEISNLTKSFIHNGKDNVVLDSLNLKVEQGDFLVILGASGTGKSTLLRIISGLEKHDAGHILFDNDIVDDVSTGDRNVGMVFQSYALYPHLNVFENIAFGIRYREKYSTGEIKERVNSIADILELENILEYYPKQLSGGQQQRVAIGRALIVQPKVLLFDEPLSNLDSSLRMKLRLKIAEYHRFYQSTTIYVTHDQQEAMALADKVVVMNKGKIEQIGTPQELYEKPYTKFVANFLGSPPMNFISAKLSKNNDNYFVVNGDGQPIFMEKASLSLSNGTPSMNNSVFIGIRPEHVKIDESGGLKGVVESIDYLGSDSIAFIRLELSGDLIQVRMNKLQSVSTGEAVSLDFPSKYIHVFDENGKSL